MLVVAWYIPVLVARWEHMCSQCVLWAGLQPHTPIPTICHSCCARRAGVRGAEHRAAGRGAGLAGGRDAGHQLHAAHSGGDDRHPAGGRPGAGRPARPPAQVRGAAFVDAVGKYHCPCDHGLSRDSVGQATASLSAAWLLSPESKTSTCQQTSGFQRGPCAHDGWMCFAVRSGSGRRSSSVPGRPRLQRPPPLPLPGWSLRLPRMPRRRAARRRRRRPAARQTMVRLAAACMASRHSTQNRTDDTCQSVGML